MHPTNLTRGHPPRSSRPPSRVSAWEKGKHSHLSLTYHKNCGSSCSLLINTPLTLSLKKKNPFVETGVWTQIHYPVGLPQRRGSREPDSEVSPMSPSSTSWAAGSALHAHPGANLREKDLSRGSPGRGAGWGEAVSEGQHAAWCCFQWVEVGTDLYRAPCSPNSFSGPTRANEHIPVEEEVLLKDVIKLVSI